MTLEEHKAKEDICQAVRDIGSALRCIDTALDAIEDLKLKLPIEDYESMMRQISLINSAITMISNEKLRDGLRELYTPLMARLLKFNPEPLQS